MTEQTPSIFTTNSFGDRFIEQVNRDDFIHLGAEYTFRERFGNTLFKPHTLYLVVGSDSLLPPAYIEQIGIPSGSNYIFIEPLSVFPKLADQAGKLNERFRIINPGQLQQTLDQIGTLGANHYLYRDQVEIIQSVAATNDHIDQYAQLNAWLSNTLATIYTDVGGDFNLTGHYSNAINNSPDSLVSTQYLKGLFAGKSITILAGGPSLEENIPWLIAHRQSLVVIAVSRISLRLHELNIKPDIFIHADPQEAGFDTGKGIYHFPDTLFVYSTSSNTRLTGQWGGMRAVINNRLPWDCTLNEECGITEEGNTVTNVAISLAVWLGAQQILLLGVDLCHSPEGFSHANGSNERKSPPPIHLNLNRVTTNDGNTAYTTDDFSMAAKALDLQAKKHAKKGIYLVNPSVKAVRLTHVVHLPVEQFIPKILDEAPLQQLTAIYPEINLADYLEQLIRELKRARQRLHVLSIEARKATNELHQAAANPKRIEKAFKLAQKAMNRINSDSVSKAAIAMHWHRFTEVQNIIEESEEGYQRSMRGQKAYLSRFIEITEPFERLLEEALERANCRQEENSRSPDFRRLFRQWAADNQPGRAHTWVTQHPLAMNGLAEDIRHQLEAFISHFKSTLAEEKTGHLSMVAALANLDNVFPRVTLLFKSRDNEGFDYLLEILSHYPPEEAKPYQLFTSGMQAELQGDINRAIASYQSLLECESSPVLEPTLKRVAAICLEAGDLENALFAIQSLAEISAEHVPSYAELLASMGYTDDAMAVYEAYTTSNPNDLTSRYKFGLLCRQLGAYEQANKIGQEILSTHSNFSPARELLGE